MKPHSSRGSMQIEPYEKIVRFVPEAPSFQLSDIFGQLVERSCNSYLPRPNIPSAPGKRKSEGGSQASEKGHCECADRRAVGLGKLAKEGDSLSPPLLWSLTLTML